MTSKRYGNQEPEQPFSEPSTFDFPSMDQSDPNPGGSLDSVPNAAFGGYGTGGETLMPDGSATTRHKGSTMIVGDSGVDGGSP
jgi:hypothetical protein